MNEAEQDALLYIEGARARSASELCSLSDLDFVRAAYLTLLARKADPDGERTFTAQLRSGVAKSQILLALFSSQEARGITIQLPGLRRRLFTARVSKFPVVKLLASLGVGEHSNSRRARAIRRLENEVGRRVREGEVTASILARLAEKVERLNMRLINLESARGQAASDGHKLVTVEQLLHGGQ